MAKQVWSDKERALQYFGFAEKAETTGDINYARYCYQEVIKYVPDHTTARLRLALIYLDLNYIQDAMEELQALLTFDPVNVDANFYLGKGRVEVEKLILEKYKFS